jgi:hypothetical protein
MENLSLSRKNHCENALQPCKPGKIFTGECVNRAAANPAIERDAIRLPR